MRILNKQETLEYEKMERKICRLHQQNLALASAIREIAKAFSNGETTYTIEYREVID